MITGPQKAIHWPFISTVTAFTRTGPVRTANSSIPSATTRGMWTRQADTSTPKGPSRVPGRRTVCSTTPPETVSDTPAARNGPSILSATSYLRRRRIEKDRKGALPPVLFSHSRVIFPTTLSFPPSRYIMMALSPGLWIMLVSISSSSVGALKSPSSLADMTRQGTICIQ